MRCRSRRHRTSPATGQPGTPSSNHGGGPVVRALLVDSCVRVSSQRNRVRVEGENQKSNYLRYPPYPRSHNLISPAAPIRVRGGHPHVLTRHLLKVPCFSLHFYFLLTFTLASAGLYWNSPHTLPPGQKACSQRLDMKLIFAVRVKTHPKIGCGRSVKSLSQLPVVAAQARES